MPLFKVIKNEFENCTTRIIGSPHVPVSINFTTIKKGYDIKGMPRGHWKDNTKNITIHGFRLGRNVIAFCFINGGASNE